MYNLLRSLKGEAHYYDLGEETHRLIDLSLDLSFMDFLRSGDSGITNFIRNPQVRALQGNKPADLDNILDPESLERAMSNLAQMDLIGLLEQYSKSLDLFSSMMEHALPRPENLNASPERRKLTAKEADMIGRENHLDLTLYRHACALFDSRLMRQ